MKKKKKKKVYNKSFRQGKRLARRESQQNVDHHKTIV